MFFYFIQLFLHYYSYNELLEENNNEFIQKDIFKFKYTTKLIEIIMNFNQKTNKYHCLDQISTIKTTKSKYYSNNKIDTDKIISEMEKQTVDKFNKEAKGDNNIDEKIGWNVEVMNWF